MNDAYFIIWIEGENLSMGVPIIWINDEWSLSFVSQHFHLYLTLYKNKKVSKKRFYTIEWWNSNFVYLLHIKFVHTWWFFNEKLYKNYNFYDRWIKIL